MNAHAMARECWLVNVCLGPRSQRGSGTNPPVRSARRLRVSLAARLARLRVQATELLPSCRHWSSPVRVERDASVKLVYSEAKRRGRELDCVACADLALLKAIRRAFDDGHLLAPVRHQKNRREAWDLLVVTRSRRGRSLPSSCCTSTRSVGFVTRRIDRRQPAVAQTTVSQERWTVRRFDPNLEVRG